ncbi:MAG: glycosyl transferase, partial [Pseudomonadota bacterium]|nr:glycosyl transferase [Pseudomonadota bacterium]
MRRMGARFIEGIGHQDIPWIMQLALAARRVGFVRDPLYGYRMNPASVMNDPSKTGVLRRARSYIRVIQHIAATANHIPRGSPVRKALLRQANHEGGHFLGLVRKRFQDEADRSQVAREFLESGLSRVMFRGAV